MEASWDSFRLVLPESGPLYERVAKALRQAIAQGQFKEDDRLPTEAELADELGINRLTVRRGYQMLKEEGLIVQVRGRGTSVAVGARAALGLKTARQLQRLAWVYYPKVYGRLEFILMDIFAGVADQCRSEGIELCSIPIAPAGEVVPEAVEQELLACDGIILLQTFVDDRVARWSFENRKPTVTTWDIQPTVIGASVSYDRREAGRLAAKHLAECGYRKIGFLGEMTSRSGGLKLVGFLDGLLEQGLTIQQQWLVEAGGSPGAAYGAAQKFLNQCQGNLPEAIHVAADFQAVEVINALRDAGVSVPGQIAIIGHDDVTGLAEEHGLTTIRSPRQQIGQRAVELLRHWPADGSVPADVTLEPSLVCRQTTQRVKKVSVHQSRPKNRRDQSSRLRDDSDALQ